jgi:hypothetical protein
MAVGKRRWFLQFFSFGMAVVLTGFVTEFHSHSLLDLFYGSSTRQNDNVIYLSLPTINYNRIATIKVSDRSDNGFSDLLNPSTFYLDIDFAYDSPQRIVVNDLTSCTAHDDLGNAYPEDAAPPVTITQYRTSHIAVVDTGPYRDRYWLKCEIRFPVGAVNSTLTHRRINIVRTSDDDIIRRVKERDDLSPVEVQALTRQIDSYFNTEKGARWFRDMQFDSEIDSSANSVEVRTGSPMRMNGEDADYTVTQTSFEWEDVRYTQLRDILLVVIGAFVGIGTGIMLETPAKAARTRPGLA